MEIDLATIVKAAGIFGIAGIIFAETGLLVGIFLPGDSLLFTAGFLASQGYLHIVPLAALSFLGAFCGDNFGYFLGRKMGPRIFKREDSIFFHKDHLQKAENFYRKHGPKAVIFGRFIPIVRTFVAVLAGVGRMRYPVFLIFSAVGGLLWAVGVTYLGYFLGRKIPNADQYLLPIVAAIILISFLPVISRLWRDPETRLRIQKRLKRFFIRSGNT